MSSSEDRQAKALEGILGQLTLIVALMKKQTEKTLNVDKLRELRTASGRLVGYVLPSENIDITVEEWKPSTNPEMIALNEELKKHFPGKPTGVHECGCSETHICRKHFKQERQGNWTAEALEEMASRKEPDTRQLVARNDKNIAFVNDRPGVGDFVKTVEEPFDITVTSLYTSEGEFCFAGLINNETESSPKTIRGIIKDVY